MATLSARGQTLTWQLIEPTISLQICRLFRPCCKTALRDRDLGQVEVGHPKSSKIANLTVRSAGQFSLPSMLRAQLGPCSLSFGVFNTAARGGARAWFRWRHAQSAQREANL